MSHIEAIYRQGVFKPLEPVYLQEDQHVRLSVEPTELESSRDWLHRVRLLQDSVARRHGHLPDSAPEISQDRLR
ncbi:MAG TPA: antitoxin family protein [Tepidisphaeraceae bacterium]|nr:antitoxin family protein [Tepidisphaeraceae bacterium]